MILTLVVDLGNGKRRTIMEEKFNTNNKSAIKSYLIAYRSIISAYALAGIKYKSIYILMNGMRYVGV